MSAKHPFRVSNRLKSFKYAFQGLWYALETQHNLWIHLVSALLVVLLVAITNVSPVEWCLLVFAIGFVFVAELLNTSIEALTDLASPNIHPLAKIAKDVGAAAVLVAATTSFIVGIIIFLPKILALF